MIVAVADWDKCESGKVASIINLEDRSVDAQLRLIARPTYSRRAIVFIHGGWCQDWGKDKEDLKDLTNSLRRAGWEDSIYQLWWDSSENPWSNFYKIGKIMDRAKQVGSNSFSSLVSSGITEQEVSILAYSFGARVAYYALESWAGQRNLGDVILLGGAIKRDKSKNWGYAASKLNGHLFNIHNKRDPMLQIFHQCQGGISPCGRKPIKEKHSRIENIDASDIGMHHSLRRYLEYLPSFTR